MRLCNQFGKLVRELRGRSVLLGEDSGVMVMLAVYTFVRRAVRELIQFIDRLSFSMDGNLYSNASRSSCAFLSGPGWGNIVFDRHILSCIPF